MYSQNRGRYVQSEQWPVCTVRTLAGMYSQNRGRYVQSEQWPVCTARTGAGMYSQNSPLPLNHPSNTLYKVRLLRPPSASLTALLILLIFKRGLLFKRCQWLPSEDHHSPLIYIYRAEITVPKTAPRPPVPSRCGSCVYFRYPSCEIWTVLFIGVPREGGLEG